MRGWSGQFLSLWFYSIYFMNQPVSLLSVQGCFILFSPSIHNTLKVMTATQTSQWKREAPKGKVMFWSQESPRTLISFLLTTYLCIIPLSKLCLPATFYWTSPPYSDYFFWSPLPTYLRFLAYTESIYLHLKYLAYCWSVVIVKEKRLHAIVASQEINRMDGS